MMFRHGWIFWCIFLAVPHILCSLEIIDENSGVTCSQGLWDCTLKNATSLDINSFSVTARSLDVKLCCRGHVCALCLLMHVEVHLDKPGEVEHNSGLKEDTEETKDSEAETCSVTMCYKTPEAMPTCKKVEFTVNQVWPFERSIAQISVTITSDVITYGSHVSMTLPPLPEMIHVNVPSLEDVCTSDINTNVQECHVPKVNYSINKDNEVELHFPGSNSVPVVCLQNEMDGICQIWKRKPIPLESVSPCTCFQAWYEGVRTRSRSCPFQNNTVLWINMKDNCTLSLSKDNIASYGTVLKWNVTAPCRLQGEVWACERSPGNTVCTEKNALRQTLGVDQWRQNSNGVWENDGFFANINLENYPCVMVKNMNGEEYQINPLCHHIIIRGRWSLFAVAVMLLLSLTLLITFCLQRVIKKSVQSWCHGLLVKTVHRPHVLVLSPPNSDEEVSAEVCHLGSLLSSMDFSVTVDQWSRQALHSLGPLPWSHYHLFSMDSQCERVVLVLTPTAMERAQAWNNRDSPVIGLSEEPYSDVFKALLFAIQAFKTQDRASERFVLVTFDSLWTDSKTCKNKLPKILQGLPLFHLPSETKALLLDLQGSNRTQFRHLSWNFSRNKNKNLETSQEAGTKLLPQS